MKSASCNKLSYLQEKKTITDTLFGCTRSQDNNRKQGLRDKAMVAYHDAAEEKLLRIYPQEFIRKGHKIDDVHVLTHFFNI